MLSIKMALKKVDGGTSPQRAQTVSDIWFMSFVGNCKFNYFAAQMTTHETA
jgi:hypothetical protein